MTAESGTRMTPERRERAARRRARGPWWIAGHTLGALVALLVGLAGVALMPESLAVARSEGVMGTFTAEVAECHLGRGGETCSWTGTFVSDDGQLVIDYASFDSELPDGPGDTFHLLFPEHGDFTVYEPGDKVPLGVAVAFIVGGLAYLAWRALVVAAWAWSRRREPPAVGSPSV